MNMATPHRGQTQSGYFRAINVLALFLAAASLAVPAHATGTCPAGSPDAESALAEFDRRIGALDDSASIHQSIHKQLCARDKLFAFLTGEGGYDYVSCFIEGKDTDRFWNTDHTSSRKMLADFRLACARWANDRYRNLLNRIAARGQAIVKIGNETAPASAARPKTAIKPPPAAAPKASAAAIRERAQQAIRETMAGGGPNPKRTMLQWNSDAGEAPYPAELSAWLLSLDLDTEHSAPATHARNHLDDMLGTPRVTKVSPAENPNAYRVTMRSQRMDFALEGWVEGDHAPSPNSKAWVLFRHEGNALLPAAAVLHDDQRVFRTVRIVGKPLSLRTPPENGGTRLEDREDGLRLKIRCVPQGGGRASPLGSCLRPDGEIRILDSSTEKQLRYDSLPRSQRELQIEIHPPFLLLARTGGGNRRGELETTITRPGQESREPVYKHRAIARHDNIFVYSE